MAFTFPQWKGFEIAPEGHLLDQLVDLSRPMGIAYERCVGFSKRVHVHDRLMIVLPRGACAMAVRAGDTRTLHRVDGGSLLLVPEGVEHDDEGTTSIFDTVALYPSASLLRQVVADERLAIPDVRRALGRCRTLRRSAWLEQLLQEYFFARVVSRRESAPTLAFFERQILVEVLAAALGRRRSVPERTNAVTPDRTPVSGDDVAGRALRYIEADLFSTLSVDSIARHALASSSTLLRRFRRATGTSPHAYIKTRRLEEARRLIEAGTHPIGDIALLVGYENFGAFSTAFKHHFGRTPSSLQATARAARPRAARPSASRSRVPAPRSRRSR